MSDQKTAICRGAPTNNYRRRAGNAADVAPRRGWRTCIAVLALGGALCAPPNEAGAKSDVARLQMAIEQYSAAMDCPDRNQRLSLFARSEQLFRQIVEGDAEHAPVENPDLYANLGNAALQAERLGPAIVAYRRAMALDPSHVQAAQNLAYARSLLPDWVRHDESPGWIDSLFFWRSMLSDAHVKVCGAICFLAAAGLFAAGIYTAQNLWRNLAVIPLIGWTVLTASLLLDTNEGSLRNAVVVQETRVYTADSANSPARLSKPLPSGAELQLLEQRERWAELELPDGRTGWVLANAIEIVP